MNARAMICVALLAAALFLLASQAQAQETTGIRSCEVGSTPLRFGHFVGQRVDSTATITLTCTGNGNNNAFTVALSEGFSNSFLPRTMVGGAGIIEYNLYTDSARSNIWGNGQGQTQLRFGIIDFRQLGSVVTTLTVFGRIPLQTPPEPGAYTDTLLITVIF